MIIRTRKKKIEETLFVGGRLMFQYADVFVLCDNKNIQESATIDRLLGDKSK